MDWADLGPKKTLLGQTRPRRQGWSGPPDWAGLSPKMLGRFWPTMNWAELGPKQKLFWARPGPEDKAGPGSAWPSNQNGRGNYFPPAPACRTLIVLHAEKKRNECKNEGEEELLGAREAVLVTLQWRPVAVSSGAAAAPNVRRCYYFFLLLFSTR